MKQIILILLLLGKILFLQANPIKVYRAKVYITKFTINPQNEWKLDLVITIPQGMNLDSASIDSIIIQTNKGKAKIQHFSISQRETFVVITKDSLQKTLPINNDRDSIKIYCYHFGLGEKGFRVAYAVTVDEIRYGYNCPHIKGYSIVIRNGLEYFADNATTGFGYDTIDATSTLTGRLFDKNKKQIVSGQFSLVKGLANVSFDSQGNFYSQVYSGYYYGDRIYEGKFTLYSDTFSLCILPHTIVYHDIYLKNYDVGVEAITPPGQSVEVIVTPNPAQDNAAFYISINETILFNNGKITIFSNDGKPVREIATQISHNFVQQVDLKGLPSGCYTYRLVLDNIWYKTGQILKK